MLQNWKSVPFKQLPITLATTSLFSVSMNLTKYLILLELYRIKHNALKFHMCYDMCQSFLLMAEQYFIECIYYIFF